MDAVRVVVRLRPEDNNENSNSCVRLNCAEGVVELQQSKLGRKNQVYQKEKDVSKVFHFDAVFDGAATQSEVYASVQDLASSVIRGFNATVFAYGCTGSGKTYTVFGKGNADLARVHPSVGDGLVRRFLHEIFSLVEAQVATNSDCLCAVYLSFVELYNNQFSDLLCGTESEQSNNSGGIQIHEDPVKGVFLTGSDGLATPVSTADAALALVSKGITRRSIRRTDLNARSSRSHTVITLRVESRRGGVDAKATVGKFHLVDLAGSERVSLSNVTDQALVETRSINRSLASLGNVLSAVSQRCEFQNKVRNGRARSSPQRQQQQPLVPYRDSKLTFFLKDSLGGSAKTVMIATLRSPSMFYQQTHMTLLYATRARQIQNHTIVNIDARGDSSIQILYNSIQTLKQKLLQREREICHLRSLPASELDADGEPRNAHMLKLRNTFHEEQNRLEKELSKVIHNQADQLLNWRTKSKQLEKRVEQHRETIRVQKQHILTLQQSLSHQQLSSGGIENRNLSNFAAVNNGYMQQSVPRYDTQLSSRINKTEQSNKQTIDKAIQDAHGVSTLLMQALRDDLEKRNQKCSLLQQQLDEQGREMEELRFKLRSYERQQGSSMSRSHATLRMLDENASPQSCASCENNMAEINQLRVERDKLKGLLLKSERAILMLAQKRKHKQNQVL